MTSEDRPIDLSQVAVIIPALNEAENLEKLLPLLSSVLGAPSFDSDRRVGDGRFTSPTAKAMGHPVSLPGAGDRVVRQDERSETCRGGQIIVCDNGSTDGTRDVALRRGADCATEARRGYGAACYAGISRLNESIEVVAFMDADLSDDPSRLADLAAPILRDQADLVIGTRVASMRAAGSMTFAQGVANALFPKLMRLGWGHRYTDMGPFRAIRRSSLERINMRDRAYGWTIEMQIRAVEEGLRITEIEVPCRRRYYGRSKISGSLRGALLAAYWIIRTCGWLWVTKGKRARARSASAPDRSTPEPGPPPADLIP